MFWFKLEFPFQNIVCWLWMYTNLTLFNNFIFLLLKPRSRIICQNSSSPSGELTNINLDKSPEKVSLQDIFEIIIMVNISPSEHHYYCQKCTKMPDSFHGICKLGIYIYEVLTSLWAPDLLIKIQSQTIYDAVFSSSPL